MLKVWLQRVWPSVVALFVVYHVTASVLDVIPDVGLGLNRKAWREPRVKMELDAWAARLGVDRHAFEDELWTLGTGVQSLRGTLLTPFRPYLQNTGQHQAWAMFIAGTRYRDRFGVRARTCAVDDSGCAWEDLYTRGDPEHRFMASTLELARVRSAIFRWGWPQQASEYVRGCRAIARRVFLARDDLQIVECRFERSSAPSPDGAPAAGDAKDLGWGRERFVRRDDVMKEVTKEAVTKEAVKDSPKDGGP